MAWKIFHLWTTFSGGLAAVAIWVATWASVSDRGPKGAVGVCDCMSLPQSGQRKSARRNDENIAARLLTRIRGSVILSVATQSEKGFRNTVSGAFFFCRVAPGLRFVDGAVKPRWSPCARPTWKKTRRTDVG